MTDIQPLSSLVRLNLSGLKDKNQNISYIYAKCNCTVLILHLGSTQFGSQSKQLLF